MSEPFDPYYKWLGIPREEQPANFYRLLGLQLFEADPDVIDMAADRQMTHLRTFQTGKRGVECQKIMNEVAAARICLLDERRKAAYDVSLQRALPRKSPPAAAAAPPRPANTLPKARVLPARTQDRGSPEAASGDNGLEQMLAGMKTGENHSSGGKPRSLARKRPTKKQAGTYIIALGVGAVLAFGLLSFVLLSGGVSGKTGTLVLDWPASQRANLELRVNDVLVEFPSGEPFRRDYPPGTYKVTARRPRFHALEATVEVETGKTASVKPRWDPLATLILEWPAAERAGAKITLDAQPANFEQLEATQGRHQVEIPMDPGPHRLTIERPGYRTFSPPEFVLAATEFKKVAVNLLRESEGQEIDLLARLDSEKHTLHGQWQRENQSLVSAREGYSALQIPYRPPREYVLTVEAERLDSDGELIIGLVAGGSNFSVMVDAWPDQGRLTALDLVDNQRGLQNGSRRVGGVFVRGRPATIRCVVRQTRLQVECNGQQVIDWDEGYSTLSRRPEFQLPDPMCLGLASWNTPYRVTRLAIESLNPGDKGLEVDVDLTRPVEFENHYYRRFPLRLTWWQAVRACEALGGHLCCVESDRENGFLAEQIACGQPYWLGGTDKSGERSWRWLNGSQWSFESWRKMQPKRRESAQHCLMLTGDGWSRGYGSERLGFVCEWEAPPSTRPQAPSSSVLDDLRERAKPQSARVPLTFGGHGYALVETPLTWHDARWMCEKLGGYLCCVESDVEQQFLLQSLLRPHASGSAGIWLGGSDANNEGVWRWAGGNPWEFSNWRDQQPDNANGAEHALEILVGEGGRWNDREPSVRRAFICEWDADDEQAIAQRLKEEMLLADRLPLPDSEEIEQYTKLLAATLERLESAKPGELEEQAQSFLKTSDRYASRPAQQYVLQRQAAELAQRAGNDALRDKAIAAIVARFDTSEQELRGDMGLVDASPVAPPDLPPVRPPNVTPLTPPVDQAIAEGLKWLANHQAGDGGWSFDHTISNCRGQCPNHGTLHQGRNAATGLALLAFLGAGHNHREGAHQKSVSRGILFLGTQLAKNGRFHQKSGGNMYAQAIATLALCEAYRQTHDFKLHRACDSSVKLIVSAQHPTFGGWRYELKPKDAGDTSVTAWQVMALKTADAGRKLKVPRGCYLGASKFLNGVQAQDGAYYGYSKPSEGTSATRAAGLATRLLLDWKPDHPALLMGTQILGKQGPSSTNLYYTFHANRVMYQAGGDTWQRWRDDLFRMLLNACSTGGHAKGSWFTVDKWSEKGGRLYCTALALLVLETELEKLAFYARPTP